MSQNKITDLGMEYFFLLSNKRKNISIEVIDIGFNNIGDNGIHFLSKTIRNICFELK